MFTPVRYKRLVSRGEPGLACDDDGLHLGPISLISRQRTSKGAWQYQPASRDIVDHIMTVAYGEEYATQQPWFFSWLTRAAETMSDARHSAARIAAVHLGMPELSARAYAELRDFARMLKFNPNWAQEPRDAHGRWANGEESGGPVIPVIAPFSPECVKAITEAKNRCAERYANLGGGLGFDWMRRCIRMMVPEGCGY